MTHWHVETFCTKHMLRALWNEQDQECTVLSRHGKEGNVGRKNIGYLKVVLVSAGTELIGKLIAFGQLTVGLCGTIGGRVEASCLVGRDALSACGVGCAFLVSTVIKQRKKG